MQSDELCAPNPMQSDSFTKALQMYYVLHSKCKVILICRNFGITYPIVFYFIAKLCNVAEFDEIGTHP